MQKHFLGRTVRAWFPFAFVVTALSLLIALTVQQSYRQSANDPQVEMAEDAAAALAGGANLQSLALSGTIDLSHSLSPFLVFYNEDGTPTGGNGLLEGKYPVLPQGIFAFVRAYGEDRVTWQPTPDLRYAIVITRTTDASGTPDGFVMAGRSLREVEDREDRLSSMVAVAWISILLGAFLIAAFFELRAEKQSHHKNAA